MKRRARDEDGNNEVIENMSYSEWKAYRNELTEASSQKINYIDVTKEWLENAKPKGGDIERSDYTRTIDGQVYIDGKLWADGKPIKLGEEKNNDINIGKWFKNNIWGDVKFQRKIDYPLNTPSADLIVFGDCPLLNEQSIEIKAISSKNVKTFYNRIKRTEGMQSTNILYDLTEFKFSEEEILDQVRISYENLDWLDTLLIKKGDNLLYAFKKGTTSSSL